jgi:hypothetical protein
LRAGGVEDQHIDRAEAVSDRGGQPRNLVLVGDIGAEALGGAAIITDGAADDSYLFVTGPAIDRDSETVTRQAPRDHRPQAPRATRHQSDTPMRHCHMVMIPLAQLAGQARKCHHMRAPVDDYRRTMCRPPIAGNRHSAQVQGRSHAVSEHRPAVLPAEYLPRVPGVLAAAEQHRMASSDAVLGSGA